LTLQAREDFEDDLGFELRREGPASAFGHGRTILGGQYRLSCWSSPRGALQYLHPERVTTPHILAEVSNFLEQANGPVKEPLFRIFAMLISVLDEQHVPAKQILSRGRLVDFGLTDLSILEAAGPECIVLTTDSGLADYLARSHVKVVNYKALKKLYD
jgi:hypothetical protein